MTAENKNNSNNNIKEVMKWKTKFSKQQEGSAFS